MQHFQVGVPAIDNVLHGIDRGRLAYVSVTHPKAYLVQTAWRYAHEDTRVHISSADHDVVQRALNTSWLDILDVKLRWWVRRHVVVQNDLALDTSVPELALVDDCPLVLLPELKNIARQYRVCIVVISDVAITHIVRNMRNTLYYRQLLVPDVLVSLTDNTIIQN